MRDVGDEVATDLLEATALGDVLDDGQHAERAPTVVNRDRADGQGAPRGAVEVDGAVGHAVGPPFGETIGDGLGRKGVAVATGHQGFSLVVPEEHLAGLVTENQTQRESVERAAESGNFGAGLVDGVGRHGGDFLEEVQGRLDPALLVVGFGTQS